MRRFSTSSELSELSEWFLEAPLRVARRSLRAGVGPGSGESGGGDEFETQKGVKGGFVCVGSSGEDGNSRARESGVIVEKILPWEVEASSEGGPAEEEGRLMPAGSASMFRSRREAGARWASMRWASILLLPR